MNNRQHLMMTLLLTVCLLVSGCSSGIDERIYRYQNTTCPLAEPAKNIWITNTGSAYAIVGWHGGSNQMVWFYHGQPGGIQFGDVKPEFTVEETLLDSATAVFVQRGYLHFGAEDVLPVQIAASNVPPGLPARVTFPCLDNLGTRNIQVDVTDKNYATKIAGLWWSHVVLSILDDGTVVVDAEGRRAKDDDGNIWISAWHSTMKRYVMIKE